MLGARLEHNMLAAQLKYIAAGGDLLNVEGLADLLGRLALDHVGHRQACEVEQGLDVQVVGGLQAVPRLGRRLSCKLSLVWVAGSVTKE